MKHLIKISSILFFISTFYISTLTAQENQEGLIRVQKIMGVEAYFLSEPLREYEVVFDKGTGLKPSSLLTGGLVNESISDKAAKFVKKVIAEGNKRDIEFDAVIYTSGKEVKAVKFTDEATLENKGLGKVQTKENLEIYILGEPLLDYEVINKKKGGLKGKSLVTAGLVNNSIEQDIVKMAKKLNSDAKYKGKKIDAIVYSAGKSAIGVKFK